MAESTLWVEWIHVGQATAKSHCIVLTVKPTDFLKALQAKPAAPRFASNYANEFHKRLIASSPPEAAWPTDLAVPFTDWSDIVLSLPLQMQIEVSVQAVSSIKFNRFLSMLARRPVIERLEHEILHGKSVIVQDRCNGAQRVAAVVVLKIVHEDGRILVQLGKFEDGVLETSCTLPGAKPTRSELVGDTVNRILNTRLDPFIDRLKVDSVERVVTQQQSSGFGIPTRYIRSVVNARYDRGVTLDAFLCEMLPRFVSTTSTASRPGPMWPNYSRSPIDEQIHEYLESVLHIRDAEGGLGGLYAWLTPQQFELLSKDSRKQKLAAALEGVVLPDSPSTGSNSVVQDSSVREI